MKNFFIAKDFIKRVMFDKISHAVGKIFANGTHQR